MRGIGKEAVAIAARKQKIVEKAYELFSSRTIDSVSLQDIADETGVGISMLYRYFENKQTLVVEAATWKWRVFHEENAKRRPDPFFEEMTAAEIFDFYLDSFLVLYRDHRDLLRFNQFFNVYVQSEGIDKATLRPDQEVILGFKEAFHITYQKAETDHTLRTDISEEKMFSTTLHLMLAVVTRYAVGLVYIPKDGFDPMEELETEKRAIMREYAKA